MNDVERERDFEKDDTAIRFEKRSTHTKRCQRENSTRSWKKILDRFSSAVRNACEKREDTMYTMSNAHKGNCIESLVIPNYKHEVSINLMVNKIPFMSPVMCVYPLNILQEKERKERSNLEEWTLPISLFLFLSHSLFLSLDVFSFRKSSNHCWKPSHGWAWEWHQERKSRNKMKWHKEQSLRSSSIVASIELKPCRYASCQEKIEMREGGMSKRGGVGPS